MWDFISKIFGTTEQKTARNLPRTGLLRLVLVHDRAALPSGLMEQLRADLKR